jgi:LysR family transcriptional activator of dmlA
VSFQPNDLAFLCALASAGSLTAAARELGVSPAAVSKHLAAIEVRLGAALVNRTSRRMSLTPEGEIFVDRARRILEDIRDMEQQLVSSSDVPRGLLRVNATLGFGRNHVAPLIPRFAARYPEVAVQLHLSTDPPAVTDDAYDVSLQFGTPPDARVIARQIAPSRRLICASPAYLARCGTPRLASDLLKHNCISIRQGDEAYGTWKLLSKGGDTKTEAIKVRGSLTTNDGAVAVNWALDGYGIVMRAEWDVERHLRTGRLVQILPDQSTPDTHIYAVYPKRHQATARVRTFVDFVAKAFEQPLSGASAAPRKRTISGNQYS